MTASETEFEEALDVRKYELLHTLTDKSVSKKDSLWDIREVEGGRDRNHYSGQRDLLVLSARRTRSEGAESIKSGNSWGWYVDAAAAAAAVAAGEAAGAAVAVVDEAGATFIKRWPCGTVPERNNAAAQNSAHTRKEYLLQ